MSSQPPKIDQRTYNDLVQQLSELVSATEIEVDGKTTQWLPPSKTEKSPDPGYALIRIFSRMAALVRDRLNRVPENNFLTFLDLLGGQLNPPQPARVPLTFHLAEGSTSEGLVAAQTPVAAPADADSPTEIVFETTKDLVVTTAKLEAVYVKQPDRDTYHNCTEAATGVTDQSFFVFQADSRMEHHLYIACEEIFSLGNLTDVKLTFKMASDEIANAYNTLSTSWSYWDGKIWKVLTVRRNPQGADWIVTISNLPSLTPYTVNGIEKRWIRASLSTALISDSTLEPIARIEASAEVKQTKLAPDVCLFNSTPLDLSKDFYPFGDRPRFNDIFYIASQAAFSRPGTTVTLTVTLSKAVTVTNRDSVLAWEGWNGSTWKPLPSPPFLINQAVQANDKTVTIQSKDLYSATRIRISNGTKSEEHEILEIKKSSENTTLITLKEGLKEAYEMPGTKVFLFYFQGFSTNGIFAFLVPDWLKPNDAVNGELHYWIRARITSGLFGSPAGRKEQVFFSGITSITSITPTADSDTSISIGSEKAFSAGDIVWIFAPGSVPEMPLQERPQEVKIGIVNQVDPKKLTLASKITASAHSWVIRNPYVATEQIPETYTPPVVQSIELGIDLTLNASAFCQAFNDFTYKTFVTTVTTTVREAIAKSVKNLPLVSVAGLTVGDRVRLTDANGNNPEELRIININGDIKQVTVAQEVQNVRSPGATVKLLFRPFVVMDDRDPTLYLGFSQPDALDQQNIPPFNNNAVTLYAEVEPLSPANSLPEAIALETTLSQSQTKGSTQIVVENAIGWRIGDRIQIEYLDPPSSSQKTYDSYFIASAITPDPATQKYTVPLTTNLQRDYGKDRPVIRPALPLRLTWEYSSPAGWSQLPGVQDETQGLFQRGLIQFIGPPDFKKTAQFGRNDLYWLRMRWEGGNFPIKPRLRRLLTNTTWAVQAMTLNQEVLGSSNGDRNQVFSTSQQPVLEGQQVEVQEASSPDEEGMIEPVWVRWQEVPDFYQSQSGDRHYMLDRQTGKVQFGDGQSGLVPPRGLNNIRITYRTGGGVQGNKAAQTITQLKTTIPYVDRVVNLEAAGGGAEQEDLEHLKERVPKQLRHRDRAVTKQDMEDLAYAASTEVARVKVVAADELADSFQPLLSDNWLDPKTEKPLPQASTERTQHKASVTHGTVRIIVVPKSRDRQPTPSLALLKQVEDYLHAQAQPGVNLIVTGARWAEVKVTAAVVPRSPEQADQVRTAILQELDSFLHPLTGGQGRAGWAFGRYPHYSDVYGVIQAVPGVDHVHVLTVEPDGTSLGPDYFIYSGSHQISMTLDQGGTEG